MIYSIVQRVAMLPVANTCNKVPADCTPFVMALVAYMCVIYEHLYMKKVMLLFQFLSISH